MASLKIQNVQLTPLASWLNELSLSGKLSRTRTRFVNSLVEKIAAFDTDKRALLDKYVNKEENGTWKKVVDNDVEKWDISPEKIGDFDKEIVELSNEKIAIDVLDSNREIIATIKDLVLNTEYVFGPREGDSAQEKVAKLRQAGDYNVWCEAFENVDLA